MLKRICCLILAALMMAALAACGDGDPEPTGQASTSAGTTAAAPHTVSADTEPVTEEPTEAPGSGSLDLKGFIRAFDRTPQMEEQVIHDADGVTITAAALRYDSIRGAAVMLRAENDSEQDLLIQADTCAVNGYMVKAELSLSVKAGKEAEGEMYIPYASLALAGASAVSTVEFTLILVDQSNYEVSCTCEPACLQTTAVPEGETYEPVYEADGQTVYDDKGIRIALKGVDRGRQISEYPALVVCIHNGSDRAISVQAGSMLVNGYEMTSTMTATVLPGKGAVDLVEIFDMDLDEYGIEEIETVELRFRVVDEKTWEKIAETDTVLVEEE